MACKYNWDNATKLAKLVEALEDKALAIYSSLPETTWESYSLVKAKFNARFGPKEPSRTARNQLAILQQNLEEELEEFAEHALRILMDAWGTCLLTWQMQMPKRPSSMGFLTKMQLSSP